MIGVPPLRLRHPEKGTNGRSRNEFALVTDLFFISILRYNSVFEQQSAPYHIWNQTKRTVTDLNRTLRVDSCERCYNKNSKDGHGFFSGMRNAE